MYTVNNVPVVVAISCLVITSCSKDEGPGSVNSDESSESKTEASSSLASDGTTELDTKTPSSSNGSSNGGATSATAAESSRSMGTATSGAATESSISSGTATSSESSNADGGNVEAGAGLHWFPTCGDPVCRDEVVDSGLDECSAKASEGAACSKAGTQCDAHLGCGSVLICADSDPRQSPGGCPISRARFKRDIEYVTDSQRESLARQVLELPLATYTYRQDPDQKQQLGFILEDVEPSLVVDSRRDQVNLYAYTSFVVAALQEQHKEIERLRGQLERLEEQSAISKAAALECSAKGVAAE